MTKLSKYLSYVLYLLLAVTLVFAGLFYFGGEVEDAGYPLYTESFLNWGKVLLMVAAAVAILLRSQICFCILRLLSDHLFQLPF